MRHMRMTETTTKEDILASHALQMDSKLSVQEGLREVRFFTFICVKVCVCVYIYRHGRRR